MKKYLLILLMLPVYKGVAAQEQSTLEKQADLLYARYEYARAAFMYSRVANKKHVKTVTLERLADCYRQMNRYEAAATWYAKVLQQPGASPEAQLYYGDMLKSMGKYDEARAAFQRYASQVKNVEAVTARLAGCDSAVTWMRHPEAVNISNVARINSGSSDWGAAYFPGGLVYVSDTLLKDQLQPGSKVNKNKYGRTGRDYYKIYIADTSERGEVYLHDFTSSFNRSRYHAGPVIFDSTFKHAYITLTNPGRKLRKEKSGTRPVMKFGYRRLELFSSSLMQDGRWSTLSPFPYNKADEYSLGQAALSLDNNTLYFASDMAGGFGKTDLWYCERQADGKWGLPVNCGAAVNTAEEEAFPTIAPDGALYFSSKGWIGMGGYDLFVARGSKNQWTQPENLKYPVNSPADDFYFITYPDGSNFYASNREGGKGSDDIYQLRRVEKAPIAPGLTIPFIGTVCMDDACIYIFNKDRAIGWCFMATPGREISLTLEQNTRYEIRVTYHGVTHTVQQFSTSGAAPGVMIRKDICIEKK